MKMLITAMVMLYCLTKRAKQESEYEPLSVEFRYLANNPCG